MYLADQGAEVIRVEPVQGAPRLGVVRADGAPTGDYLVVNRGKRSLPLNLKSEEGQAIGHALVKSADVALVAWPPGVAPRFRMDYETLNPINPRLVYAQITGWGPVGPHRMKIGYDYLVQAFSGIMASQLAEDGTPVGNGYFPADMSIPMYLPYAIMLALWQREKTNLGQKIETSQLQAQLAMQLIHFVFAGQTSLDLVKVDSTWKRPPHTYRTRDGRYLVIMPVSGTWRRFFEALELGEAPEDPRLELMAWPPELSQALIPKLVEAFAKRSLADWLERFEAADLARFCAPVNTRSEAFADPQVVENEIAFTQDHPILGPIQMLKPPFSLSGSEWVAPAAAPALGADADDVLGSLGYSLQDIADLRARGVVA
jgi:formyl-CoA transferase